VSEIRIVRCDRCGQQVDSSLYGVEKDGRLIRPPHWKYVDPLDLCTECYRSFQEWVKGSKRPSGAERD
jgi:hypothetical protein